MPTKMLGPWAGGLNLSANRDMSVFLADGELGEAENVIFSPEGFIQPRPGCKVVLGSDYSSSERYFTILGTVDSGVNGIYAIVQGLFSSNNTAIFKVRDGDDIELLYSRTDGVVYTHLIVHSGFVSEQVETIDGVEYRYPADTGVILFSSTPNVATILPISLDVITTPGVDINPIYKIPASHKGFIVKDRLFLFNGIGNIMSWSPAQYILDFRTDLTSSPFGNDTAGQEIIEHTTVDDTLRAVEFYNNNFYIFKRADTFMFTYQMSPLTDGYLRKISGVMGAYDSTMYKDNVVVINNKGVFRMEGTEFIDLQIKMNFRFEVPLDQSYIGYGNIFIENFNDNIIFGYRDVLTDPVKPKTMYYNMNGINGAWSKWTFDYNEDDGTSVIASPGSKFALCQKPNSPKAKMIFTTFDGQYIVYLNWKPHNTLYDYHLDSNLSNLITYDDLYFPRVAIKTTADVGDSILSFKKLYRYYLRMYLSDAPASLEDDPIWTISINYNHYRFNDTQNPIFGLYPTKQPFPDPRSTTVETAVYERVYQVKIAQQRVKEFLFELKRRYSKIPGTTVLDNPDTDRPIKTGYYFNIAGIWFDYETKTKL